MLNSHHGSNDHPKILPEMLKEKVANIQALLTQKDMEELRNTIIADLKEPIKKMCNQASNPNKKISDAEEIANEATFLGLYVEIVNGLLHIQTTSKTFLIEALDALATDFKTVMQIGSGQEKKKNFGNHKNPFNFLNQVLQSETPIETLQKSMQNIKEYAETAKQNIMTGKSVPEFEFPIVKPLQVFESKDEHAQRKSNETVTLKSERNLVASILEPLKQPFYKIISLKGEFAFLDKAARLAALVDSHYMFTTQKIPSYKIAIVIVNTLLNRIAHLGEKERTEDLRTLLEFLKVLSSSSENIMSEMLRTKPVLLTRVQQSIQSNLDSQTLADFNKRFKNGNELTPVTTRRASTQTLVLKTLEEAISADEIDDEAIIAGGQVDDPIEGIERPEEIRYEAEVLLTPGLLSSPPIDQEGISGTTLVVEPVKIRVA